jgi:molecular chaperone DnaK
MLTRDDNGWSSGEIVLDSKGMFFTSAKVREKGQTAIEISVRVQGQRIPCEPSMLTVTSGLQVGSAPLPAGIGIALADGKCLILHKGGALLPRPEEVYRTTVTRAVRKGSTDALRIPVMSGDDPVAEHNRCGTVIVISGTDVSRDVPAGTEVEIGMSVDTAGVPTVRVYVPLLDETFEPAEPMRLEYEPADILRERKEALEKRLEKIEEDADGSALDQVSADAMALRMSDDIDKIDTLADKAEGGDAVAAGQATHLIAEISKKAAAIESRVALPAATAEFNSSLDDARKGVAQYGKPEERKIVEELAREGNKAIQAKDVAGLRHCTEQLDAISRQFVMRDPGFWIGFLRYLGSQQSSFTDQAAGRRLLAEGAQAAQRGDVDSVQSVVQQLMGLLPPQEAQAAASRLTSHVV